MKKKKGLSPTITTILLIALTVVIIGIIFLWFRGLVEEGVVKFGKNIQLVCEDVDFDASYSSDTGLISITNRGNIPVFTVNLEISESGNYRTRNIKDIDAGLSWPPKGLNQDGNFIGNIKNDVGSATKIKVLPVLIGTSKEGQKTFVCGGQYGRDINV
jgi:flagellin-like protein